MLRAGNGKGECEQLRAGGAFGGCGRTPFCEHVFVHFQALDENFGKKHWNAWEKPWGVGKMWVLGWLSSDSDQARTWTSEEHGITVRLCEGATAQKARRG